MNQMNEVEPACISQSEMLDVGHQEEKTVGRSENAKSPTNMESLSGRITFEEDGSEAIIKLCGKLSNDSSSEDYAVGKTPVQIVTIRQYDDSDSKDSKEHTGGVLWSRKFKVTDPITELNGDGESALNITEPLIKNGAIDSQ